MMEHFLADLSDSLLGVYRAALRGTQAITEAMSRFDAGAGVSFKQDGSLVTQADLAADRVIGEELRRQFPGISILSEEATQPLDDAEGSGLLAVVDPLDGTTNFTRGLKPSSVSIGLLKNRSPVCAVVMSVDRTECFCASQGRGAWLLTECQRKRLQIGTKPLREAILAIGFNPAKSESRGTWLRWIQKLQPPTCFRLRVIECASLELCWTASGKLDGYLHPTDNPWDMCAGGIIVTEAGGVVLSGEATTWNPLGHGIIASAPGIAAELTELIR